MSVVYFFRELRPTVKLLAILLAAAIPFGIFVGLTGNESELPTEEAAPIPTNSPDTPLAFPFGTSSTTSTTTTTLESTTTTTRRPTTRRPTTRRRATTTPVSCTPRTYPLPVVTCPAN